MSGMLKLLHNNKKHLFISAAQIIMALLLTTSLVACDSGGSVEKVSAPPIENKNISDDCG